MEETNNVQTNDTSSVIVVMILIISLVLNVCYTLHYFSFDSKEKEAIQLNTNLMFPTSNLFNNGKLYDGKLYDVSQSVTRVTSDDLSEPIYELVTEIDYKQKDSLINFGDNPVYSVFFIKDLKEVNKVKCIEYEKALLEAQRLYLLNNQKCK